MAIMQFSAKDDISKNIESIMMSFVEAKLKWDSQVINSSSSTSLHISHPPAKLLKDHEAYIARC
jgi:hypothetical protein